MIYLSSGLTNNRSKHFCGHVEHRCKLVQIAEAVTRGKTFNRDELAIVRTCVVEAFSGSSWTQSPTVLDTRCRWSRRPSLPLPCPNKAGGTHFTDGKLIFWEFPAVGIAPLDLKAGILKLQLWEQIHILSVLFCLLFLCFKPWESDAACNLSYLENVYGQWIAVLLNIWGSSLGSGTYWLSFGLVWRC